MDKSTFLEHDFIFFLQRSYSYISKQNGKKITAEIELGARIFSRLSYYSVKTYFQSQMPKGSRIQKKFPSPFTYQENVLKHDPPCAYTVFHFPPDPAKQIISFILHPPRPKRICHNLNLIELNKIRKNHNGSFDRQNQIRVIHLQTVEGSFTQYTSKINHQFILDIIQDFKGS